MTPERGLRRSLVHPQIEHQLAGAAFRKGDPSGQRFGRSFVHLVPLAHDDLKPPRAIGDDAVHLFVSRALEVRQEDMNALAIRFGSAPKSIDAACSLLERARVPAEVMMDDMATVEVEVEAFGHDLARDENFGQERTVEAEKPSVPSFRWCFTECFFNDAQPMPLVEFG
jgi:hypothetical protein